MILDDLFRDVMDHLNLTNGSVECIYDEDRRKFVRTLKRIFDRFSIDSRKIPIVQQLDFEIRKCVNRFTIGPSGDFNTWSSPQTIYYAAWMNSKKCVCHPNPCCETQSVKYGLVGEVPIRIVHSVEEFHRTTPVRECVNARPCEMWWQQSAPNGEMVFDSVPVIGDRLRIRAAMPFNVNLDCKADQNQDDEWEFYLSPYGLLCCDDVNSIVCDAKHHFTGDECWSYQTTALTCEVCPRDVTVTVTAKKKPKISEPITLNHVEFPPGYYDATRNILVYEIAPSFGKERTNDMISDRNGSIMLLHRNNERRSHHQDEIDPTLPWNNRNSGIGVDCITRDC